MGIIRSVCGCLRGDARFFEVPGETLFDVPGDFRPTGRLTDLFAVTFFEVRRDFVPTLRLTTLFAAFIFFDLILRAVARFLRLAIVIPIP
jgi:hypothetical protein